MYGNVGCKRGLQANRRPTDLPLKTAPASWLTLTLCSLRAPVFADFVLAQRSMRSRRLHLRFFEVDNTLEIYDGKNRRQFLKRVRPSEDPSLGDFYLGSVVTIFSRKMKVVEYADKVTADYFATARQLTAAIVLHPGRAHLGKVLKAAQEAGLAVGRIRSVRLTGRAADDFARRSDEAHASADVGSRKGPGGAELSAALSAGPFVAVELVGDRVVARWQQLVGPADGSRAGTLSATLGSGCVYASPSRPAAAAEIEYLFERPQEPTATFTSCSLCVIKPHAVLDGTYATIIDEVLGAGFTISAIRTIGLDAPAAEDLLEVYKGVVSEYPLWIKQFASGVSVALEVVGDGVVPALRSFFGPYEPEVAKILRPDTLRAKYARNSVKNLAHVTDIDVDGPLECKFIFSVLADYQ